MTQPKLKTVIARIIAGDSDPALYDRVVVAGSDAVSDLVAMLAADRAVPAMSALLGALELGDPLAVLAPLTARDEGSVADAALASLAASGDPRARPVIEACLSRLRFAAAAALGELGDAAAIDALRGALAPLLADAEGGAFGPDWLSSSAERRDLRFVITAVTALARLGDDSLAPVVLQLATLHDPDDAELGGDVRAEALAALTVVGTAGVADTVRRALDDASDEVVAQALRTGLVLGRRSEAESWIEHLGRERHDRKAKIVLWYLHALTGSYPGDHRDRRPAPRVLEAWWRDMSAQLAPGVCYRDGKPIDLGAMIAQLADDPLALRGELRAHTGAPCFLDGLTGSPVFATERARIDAWWQANAARFPPGRLYRWGRRDEPGAVD